MSLAQQSPETKHDVVLFKLIDDFSELEQSGQQFITPSATKSVIGDVCIDLKVRVNDLPKVIQRIYAEADLRITQAVERGNPDFRVDMLISSIERSI